VIDETIKIFPNIKRIYQEFEQEVKADKNNMLELNKPAEQADMSTETSKTSTSWIDRLRACCDRPKSAKSSRQKSLTSAAILRDMQLHNMQEEEEDEDEDDMANGSPAPVWQVSDDNVVAFDQAQHARKTCNSIPEGDSPAAAPDGVTEIEANGDTHHRKS
jgi:hypothetical protein